MAEFRAHIINTVLARLSRSPERRAEALKDFLALNLPLGEDAAAELSNLIPQAPDTLYQKWAGLFADRLLETLPQDQLAELCDNSPDNSAALVLTYLMFMESARMERQIADDLRALGPHAQDDGMGALPASRLNAAISSPDKQRSR